MKCDKDKIVDGGVIGSVFMREEKQIIFLLQDSAKTSRTWNA